MMIKKPNAPCVMFAILMALAGAGRAASPPDTAQLPECALAPDNPDKLAVEPCRPAAPKQARRAVRQVIGRMPSPSPVLANSDRPAATPPGGAMLTPPTMLAPQSLSAPQSLFSPQTRPLPGTVTAQPSSGPVPLYGCAGGVCRDGAGVAHTNGVGMSTIERQGKLCWRNGVWLQCL